MCSGLRHATDALANVNNGNEKMIILFTSGDAHEFTQDVVVQDSQRAQKNGCQIYCVVFSDEVPEAYEQLAVRTGGNCYKATTEAEMLSAITGIDEKSGTGVIDIIDSDGDGLYDVYEINGMHLSNGQIVYTDPNNPDTDGDGISDYDAVGGEPVVEKYTINGDVYSCTIHHAPVYGRLPDEFIYVDGRMNTDGKRYYGKMDYVPYSDKFLEEKYRQIIKPVVFDQSREAYGAAGVHGLYADKLLNISELELLGYASYNTLLQIMVCSLSADAAACLNVYMLGLGGAYEGLTENGTRDYIPVSHMVDENFFGINSANECFLQNMKKVQAVAENNLNEYNTEMYLSLSPKYSWSGCDYHDTTDLLDFSQDIDALVNLSAFGIFNKADAAATVHCTYDPVTDIYAMEYKYYLIDFYDFTFFEYLYQLDALGLARSYEIYGVCNGETKWQKGGFSVYQLF